MMNDSLKITLENALTEKFPSVEFNYSADEPSVVLPAQEIHECIQFLKTNDALCFNYLTLLGAVHYPDRPNAELCMVYHLHSWKHNQRIRVKANLSIESPEIDSITDLFTGANWLERETYDFFGVKFNKHPNLKRILNEESMDYFPMLKEYHLEDDTREDKDDRFFGRF
ncbi:MAG: NADH-quinone oxidoreductase subunit C [Bacteroidetes bacterium]|nr:NADH-quinone oxidoreductase subunit C [Bacteroidota bacterium]